MNTFDPTGAYVVGRAKSGDNLKRFFLCIFGIGLLIVGILLGRASTEAKQSSGKSEPYIVVANMHTDKNNSRGVKEKPHLTLILLTDMTHEDALPSDYEKLPGIRISVEGEKQWHWIYVFGARASAVKIHWWNAHKKRWDPVAIAGLCEFDDRPSNVFRVRINKNENYYFKLTK